MLLQLFLHLMQFYSMTGTASSTCQLVFYLSGVQQCTAEGDWFEEMCYSKMNTLFSLFPWLEEVSMVCVGGVSALTVWQFILRYAQLQHRVTGFDF